MSPSATRPPRAVKRSEKTAESKSKVKKLVPASRKAAPVATRSSGRAKPAAKPPVARAPKKAAAKPQAPVKSKPIKNAAPLKKSLVVDVEKPKKKIAEAAPEPIVETGKPKTADSEPEVSAAPKRGRKPTVKAAAEAPVIPNEEAPKSARGRKPNLDGKEKPGKEKTVRAPKVKPLGPIDDEFLADDLPGAEDVEEEDVVIPEDLSEIDPLDLPLALLDPELVEVPRPVGPTRPKPKPRVERNPKQCASCGQMYTWLSVDQLCFNCLKKKLAAKKREDESYSGFTPEAEDDGDD